MARERRIRRRNFFTQKGTRAVYRKLIVMQKEKRLKNLPHISMIDKFNL